MLIDGATFQLGPWKANGFSVASRASWLGIPALDLVLDLGWCPRPLQQIARLFLSHLHMDHALAVPYWVSRRQTQGGAAYIWVHADLVDGVRRLIDAHADAQGERWRYVLTGVREGDEVKLNSSHTLTFFETPHHAKTLGCLVSKRHRILKPDAKSMTSAEVARALANGHDVMEIVERPLLCYTSDTTPALFERRPDLLESRVLVTECSYLGGVLGYPEPEHERTGERPEVTHSHLRQLARALAAFKGETLVLSHPEPHFSHCDLRAFLLPRLPPAVRPKLSVVPHCAVPRTLIPAVPRPPPPVPRPVPVEPLEGHFEVRERPGATGWKKAKERRERSLKYPGGYTMAHIWRGKLITRASALSLYEDAYEAFLRSQPELLDWLVSTAAEVYDTHPSNLASGLHYDAQVDDEANHYQDIAVRRALLRLGVWFRGDHLVEIRGMRSEGYVLNPGVVPFHMPEEIVQPAWTADWSLPGSIECFWQSNKVIVTPADTVPSP